MGLPDESSSSGPIAISATTVSWVSLITCEGAASAKLCSGANGALSCSICSCILF